jgi:hypothetical protein
MTSITATFTIDQWDEQPIAEVDGAPKLTRAIVGKTYAGDIDGTSTTEWLMSYAADGTATFIGMERLQADIDGRHGTFVLQHVGRFADGAATADLTVVEGSGSGRLAGTTGTGELRADPNGKVTLHLG